MAVGIDVGAAATFFDVSTAPAAALGVSFFTRALITGCRSVTMSCNLAGSVSVTTVDGSPSTMGPWVFCFPSLHDNIRTPIVNSGKYLLRPFIAANFIDESKRYKRIFGAYKRLVLK
jgi:hypothetical protein